MAQHIQGPMWGGKQAKIKAPWKIGANEKEGEMNPCKRTHFPALAASQDQPKMVLSMVVASKAFRNKTLGNSAKLHFFLNSKTTLTILLGR